MTFGEQAVGVQFNPSGDPEVDRVKRLFAEIIDLCNDGRNAALSGELARLYLVAITEAQTAQMWAVKALTWQNPPP